jgi:ActR/RegA family two-component response regulator
LPNFPAGRWWSQVRHIVRSAATLGGGLITESARYPAKMRTILLVRLPFAPGTRFAEVTMCQALEARGTLSTPNPKELKVMSAKPIVLVIEKTPSEGETLARVLESPQYHTVFVENADDALAHIESPIDLVLSGISLDDPHGRDLFDRWKARRPQTPFVMMTNPAGVAAARRAVEQGAAGYVAFPSTSSEIAGQIAKWLDSAGKYHERSQGNGRTSVETQQPTAGGGHAESATSSIRIPPGTTLEDLERAAVEQALEQHHGNRTHAAKELGISVRTLQRKLKAWNRMRMNKGEAAEEAREPMNRSDAAGRSWNANPASPRQPAANYRPRLAKV